MTEKALTLRLDATTHERLRREAFEQRATISDIIRDSLAARFKAWDHDDSGPWPVSRESTRRAESTDPHPAGTDSPTDQAGTSGAENHANGGAT